MRATEYQSKQFFKTYSVPVLKGEPAHSSEEALKVARQIGGEKFVVKAQILAGGRGEAGGVKLVRNLKELESFSKKLLASRLITRQTGALGEKVEQILVEEASSIKKEYYLSFLISPSLSQIVIMASEEGGMEIEKVAKSSPEKILKIPLSLKEGLGEGKASELFKNLKMGKEIPFSDFYSLLKNLYRLFVEKDVNLLEINPLVETEEGKLIALDGKMIFDENALFRHKDLQELSLLEKRKGSEEMAKKHNLSFIQLEGDIACMVNGAGLAMATMDLIKLHGGSPANFLDVGGGASEEKIAQAFKIIFNSGKVKAGLVNIFGGIMRCDILAQGLIKALRKTSPPFPLVIRLEGTKAKEGRKLLSDSGLELLSADDLNEAARKVVEIAGKNGNFN